MKNRKKNFYLSIITIVKDERFGLEKTYNSLKFFSKVNLSYEWILIDGSSIPLDKCFIKRSNQNIIIEEIDYGIYNAMNKGIKYASGKYFLFLNAGDTINNSKHLKNLEKKLKEENSDVICFSWQQKSNKKNFRKIANFRKNKYSKLLRMPSSHQSMMFKKDLLKTYNFNENLKICGDFAMYLYSLKKGWKYKIYKKVFLVEFNTDGISSRKPLLLISESIYVIFKYASINIIMKIIISTIIFIRGLLRYLFIIFLT